jgi:two-component system KDP operon response regulator KdpE
MSLENVTIVAIDDTPSIRTFLRVSLEDEGAHLHEASNGLEGRNACKTHLPEVVILDLGLPDMDGMDLLPEIKAMPHAPTVIILSVRNTQQSFESARERGADGYLTKPFMVEDLIETIEVCIGKQGVEHSH